MSTLLTFLQTKYIGQLDCKLRFLLETHSIEEIVDEIMDWLNDPDLNYFDTTTFARDFYIGSDLTKTEKRDFYNRLRKQRFFRRLSELLNSDDFSVCSWTIYTFGKFSQTENAKYLEQAYENRFRSANPILSYRCLSELNWLSSGNINQYLYDLELEHSKTSKLTLAYYWSVRSYSPNFKMLLKDEEIIQLIIPKRNVGKIEKEMEHRLWAFEIHITEIYNNLGKITLEANFETIAKDYFNDYA